MKKSIITVIIATALLLSLSLTSCNISAPESSESTKEATVTSETNPQETAEMTSSLPKETEAAESSENTVSEATEKEETSSQEEQTEESSEETTEKVTAETTEAVIETSLKTETVTETEPPAIETEETVDTGYLNIVCREPEDYYAQLFTHPGNIYAISLNLPDDWSFEKRSKTDFEITRDGARIGKVTYGERGESDRFESLSTKSYVSGSITMEANIEKDNITNKYRHRLVFDCEKNGKSETVTLTVDYAELSEAALTRLKLYLRYKSIGNDPGFGSIETKNNGENVLILGNSFIGTSQVGSILQEMMDKCGKNTFVAHYTRGYAHVDTYAYDELIMEHIRSGIYSAVFICGFHNNDQAEHLAVMKAACDASKTTLVIFPAHNEQPVSIKYAKENVEGVYLLHWKDEIQSFIDMGGDKWDFCINDAHYHSTPLAGYIGAHMIYRSLYGEIPNCSLTDTISQEYVDSILGEYSKTGVSYKFKNADLNFFG